LGVKFLLFRHDLLGLVFHALDVSNLKMASVPVFQRFISLNATFRERKDRGNGHLCIRNTMIPLCFILIFALKISEKLTNSWTLVPVHVLFALPAGKALPMM